ncbi:MAG: hypothetical protein IH986_18920, partial [Planctomycetes bacterium]|nr:hypothetical protein [Planctomycetota bacterium]
AKMVLLRRDEDLRLELQPPKRRRMYDALPIERERRQVGFKRFLVFAR